MNAKFSRFSVSVLGSLANSVITVSHKPMYSVVANHVLLQKLEKDYADFFAVFGKGTFSGMGITVADADVYRNQPFRGIKSILKGYAKVPEYPFYKEASDLLDIIEQFGANMHLLNYGSENEKMDKLIGEFEKNENKQKLAKLNILELFQTMKTRHVDFKNTYFQQTEANAGLRMQSSATSLRTNLSESTRNYLSLVAAMKSFEEWTPLYMELAEVVKAANNTVSNPEPLKKELPES